ncbi:MAG: hypothetical protein ACE10K_04535 [Rhodothermales bacterium]
MLDEILNKIRDTDDEFSESGITKRDHQLFKFYLALYQGALYEKNRRRSIHPDDPEAKITIFDVDIAYERLLHPPKNPLREAFKPLSAGLFVTSSFKLISTLGAVSPNTAAVVFYILLMMGALAMGVYAYLKS